MALRLLRKRFRKKYPKEMLKCILRFELLIAFVEHSGRFVKQRLQTRIKSKYPLYYSSVERVSRLGLGGAMFRTWSGPGGSSHKGPLTSAQAFSGYLSVSPVTF